MGFFSSITKGVGSLMNNLTGATSSSDYAYNQSIDAMKYQNEYNTPVNQMARLKEAGLNPNLVYGSGSLNVTSAAPSGGFQGQGSGGSLLNNLIGVIPMIAELQKNEKEQELLDWKTQTEMSRQLLVGREANREYYNDKYREAEYEIFKKTGKIPETFKRTDWSGELTGLVKGLIGKGLNGD